MKRDMDLVREILLALEPLPVNFDNPMPLQVGVEPLIFNGRTNEEIAYHIRIMTQGDLISMGGIGDDGVTIRKYYGFRWHGHEFIDDVRDPKAWAAAKEGARRVGSGSLGFLWEIAKGIAKHELSAKLGFPL